MEIFDNIEKLELSVDIAEAQNIYFNKIYHELGDIIDNMKKPRVKGASSDRSFVLILLEIGQKLNINTDFYKTMLDKALLSSE